MALLVTTQAGDDAVFKARKVPLPLGCVAVLVCINKAGGIVKKKAGLYGAIGGISQYALMAGATGGSGKSSTTGSKKLPWQTAGNVNPAGGYY
jgi:hypothetical protein